MSVTVTVATSLHITRVPEVRERIARGELHRFVCTSCTGTIEVRQALLYTDFDRGHWIEVHPGEALARWPELASECTARFRHVFEHGAPVLRERTMRVRIVFGYQELREKIVLWDAGLDDAVVELAKLLAIRSDPSIIGFDDRLLVRAIEDARLVIDRYREGQPFDVFTIPVQQLPNESSLSWDDPFVSINRLVGRHAVT